MIEDLMKKIKKDAKKNNINPSIGELDGFNTKYIDEESFKNTKIKQGVFKFLSHNSKIDKIPNNITIEFYDFSDIVGGYFYNSSHGFFYKLTHKSPKFVKGTWSIPLKIDDKFKNAKEIKYVKAEETAKNSNIKIEYVNVYPTTANAKILLPYDMIITSMHLEDEKGNKYNQKGGTGYQTDTINASCPSFESLYFDKVGKLYLVFDAKENGKNKNFKIELKKQ
ncbi:hypothetical protein [Clostridium carboxidivorans]|uniref:hypothetical protein n=1 Tax=Clostridium carboxidivorans TaxID=217159 RepID=UPI0006806CC4|nr:hypothetical protein [Clostridium carboxidivorans]